MRIKRFNELINEGGETAATPGSGTAVSGGATGSFTTANGVSVSGGSTGTSFSTGSGTSGMGKMTSSQPSDTPGDVAGSTKGSGDIGVNLGGVYTKSAPRTKKKREKKIIKDSINAVENTIIKNFSDMYKESVSNNEYTYVSVNSGDVSQIYIIPNGTTEGYNIGYVDNDDNKFVLYNKFKFSKEDINGLEIREIPHKIKMDIEDTITDDELKIIEDYIKA